MCKSHAARLFCLQCVWIGGSATEQNGVQDFKISRFHWDLRISMGFQFVDFRISMGFMGVLWSSMGLFRILRKSEKILLLGFRISDFKQDFSICVQDFSLLRTPRSGSICGEGLGT